MIKPQEKQYLIQGSSYEFEKPCFKLTEECDRIYKKYCDFENEFPGFKELREQYKRLQSKVAYSVDSATLKKIQKNPEKILEIIKDKMLLKDITEVTTKYTIESLRIKKKYLNKIENVKDLLQTCLTGDGLDKINFEVKGNQYYELRKTAEEVFEDFFLNMRD